LYERHFNWIAGEACPALRGQSFQLDLPGGAGAGVWPRSDERDLERALQAARDAELGWRELGVVERKRLLARALPAWVAEWHGAPALRTALGLSASELALHTRTLGPELEELLAGRALELARGPLGAREGVLIARWDWSELALQPGRELMFALRSGRPVIVLSDARAPELADVFARALSELPPGVLSVLHDDGWTCLRAALALREAVELQLSAPVGDLELVLGALRAERAASTHVRWLTNRSMCVRDETDLEHAALAALEQSVSRGGALSGARPGAAARILVPKHRFSRFSEIFLAHLDAAQAREQPLELAWNASREHLDQALSLGHDEGATAIALARPPESKSAALFPVLFTNVEERMRLAHRARPAALVCLMRVEDESAGFALAHRLDLDTRG
jgi:acyl-CoA reductase-like NAD-dependent aldehyde dehydrogenase